MQATAKFAELYTVDPEFGFRPVFGNGIYSEYGTMVNTYSIHKRNGIQRLLFIGDSVTSRAKIIDALRALYGERQYEYWNAGVESFNTVQEVKYYRKYNERIKPDQVVLTFHLNDFETTPVAYKEGGRLRVYAPKIRLGAAGSWLFVHSYSYRLMLGVGVSAMGGGRDAIIHEVRSSLAALQERVDRSGVALTVLVFPYMRPYEEWSLREKENRERIIEILTALGIRHFDLFATLRECLAQGIVVREAEGDIWHPSEAASAAFAAYLRGVQFFEHRAPTPEVDGH
jgi:hypothetical protein